MDMVCTTATLFLLLQADALVRFQVRVPRQLLLQLQLHQAELIFVMPRLVEIMF